MNQHPHMLPGLGPARRLAGMTQQQLADSVGVDRVTIACYERGRYAPSIRMLSRLAAALKTTMGALLGEPPFEREAS